MNKFINLREGKFPIKMSLDISYLKNDVDFTNLKKGHAELLISKLSMDLFSCKGEIIILFNDKCQSCLKETVVNLTINSNVIIKDSDILLEDIDRPDETHFQKLKFFEIEKLIYSKKNINEIESIFENTGIGKMAKEITDSLNINDGNMNIQDVFQGDIMGDIFKKITAQVSSEENHSQLLTEATTICSDMQDNPLFSSLLNMQSNLMSGLMKDSLAMNPENNKDTKSIPVNSNQMEITNMSSKKKKQKQRRQSQQEKSSVQVNKVAIEEVDID